MSFLPVLILFIMFMLLLFYLKLRKILKLTSPNIVTLERIWKAIYGLIPELFLLAPN